MRILLFILSPQFAFEHPNNILIISRFDFSCKTFGRVLAVNDWLWVVIVSTFAKIVAELELIVGVSRFEKRGGGAHVITHPENDKKMGQVGSLWKRYIIKVSKSEMEGMVAKRKRQLRQARRRNDTQCV